jgi:hypothetical protein
MMLVIVSLRRLEPIVHAILVGLWRFASGFRFLQERIEDRQLQETSPCTPRGRYAVVILDDLPDFMGEALTERFRPIWRPPYWTSSSADPNTSFTSSGSPSRLFLLPPTHLRGLKDGLEEADRHRR